MKTELLYSDSLVTITGGEIIFKHYYFPTGREKVVPVAEIKRITVKPPTLKNGKWRLYGTGNFKTWFPKDTKRPKRDRIFFLTLKNQWIDVGFTVENGDRVEQILKDMDLTSPEQRG